MGFWINFETTHRNVALHWAPRPRQEFIANVKENNQWGREIKIHTSSVIYRDNRAIHDTIFELQPAAWIIRYGRESREVNHRLFGFNPNELGNMCVRISGNVIEPRILF